MPANRRLTSKTSPNAKHLFIVFENSIQKNALALETQRHRLRYAQAKNPKAAIIRSLVMGKVSVGHALNVTSDRPAYLAVDLVKGTFREHKGKLGLKDLDKFVKLVENGTLNVVRKLRGGNRPAPKKPAAKKPASKKKRPASKKAAPKKKSASKKPAKKKRPAKKRAAPKKPARQ